MDLWRAELTHLTSVSLHLSLRLAWPVTVKHFVCRFLRSFVTVDTLGTIFVLIGWPDVLSIANLTQVTHTIRISSIQVSAINHATLESLDSLLVVVEAGVIQHGTYLHECLHELVTRACTLLRVLSSASLCNVIIVSARFTSDSLLERDMVNVFIERLAAHE